MKSAAKKDMGINFYAIVAAALVGTFWPEARFYCAVMAFACGVREISWILRSFYERSE